nr:MAG TPA: hypothetical protein [Caudoviricetes sp.]DAW83090.1 MAG TPA: hypothetical protein [Caudoviricetes sp.]
MTITFLPKLRSKSRYFAFYFQIGIYHKCEIDRRDALDFAFSTYKHRS